MMVAVFAFLFLAFIFAWFSHATLARLSLGACLVLAVGLFLWEVWSPQYGFAMPWLQG